MTWQYEPTRIARLLEDHGFDIDAGAARLRADGGSISGRRDEANRGVHIAVDAGGRIRLTISTSAAESERTLNVPNGPTLTSVTETTQQETLTGVLRTETDLAAILAVVGITRDELG